MKRGFLDTILIAVTLVKERVLSMHHESKTPRAFNEIELKFVISRKLNNSGKFQQRI